MHLNNFNNPFFQSKIIVIMIMAPFYCITSMGSFVWPVHSFLCRVWRPTSPWPGTSMRPSSCSHSSTWSSPTWPTTGRKYGLSEIGLNGGQESVLDHDRARKWGSPLLPNKPVPETLSTDKCEQGQVFYLSMQKVCAAVPHCQSSNHSHYVHYLPQYLGCGGVRQFLLQYLYVPD